MIIVSIDIFDILLVTKIINQGGEPIAYVPKVRLVKFQWHAKKIEFSFISF